MSTFKKPKKSPSKLVHGLRPIVGPIQQIREETPRTKTFILSAPEIARNAVPGQFLMVWIPGVDEIPMSISSTQKSPGLIEFAAANVGKATAALHGMKEGDLLGLRGPLGHGFTIPRSIDRGPLLFVAGGCGSPPVSYATEVVVKKGHEVHVALGATSRSELLFRERFEKNAQKVIIATDDGSDGIQGTAVDAATFLLDVDSRYAACFACGPEAMLTSLTELLANYPIPLQVSLERYMKCGVGLCGHCIIDNRGSRVCVEGPVFEAKTLKNSDFGILIRDSTGKHLPLSTKDEECIP
ncbi:MAG: dihydroorotate dehydrogenase electron transfer subunit [Promethearchaeota archaeon]